MKYLPIALFFLVSCSVAPISPVEDTVSRIIPIEQNEFIVQLENVAQGDSAGFQMSRENALGKRTLWLPQGESLSFVVVVANAGPYSIRLRYSNDGPGTSDTVSLATEVQSSSWKTMDTRGTGAAGEGWDQFVQESLNSHVELAAGENTVTITVTEADEFGVELDALLFNKIPLQIEVDSVEALLKQIAEAPANSTLSVARGKYLIEDTIVIARDNLTIIGKGNATEFYLAEGVRRPVFVLGDAANQSPATTYSNIVLESFVVRGYRHPNASPNDEFSSDATRKYLRNNCITLRGVTNCRVEDVRVENAASGGLVMEYTCREIEVVGVEATLNEFDGIAIDGDVSDSIVKGCVLRHNDAAGLSLDIGPVNNRFEDLNIANNARVGAFMRDSDSNCFFRCSFAENLEDGVFISDGDAETANAVQNSFIDCLFLDNARYGIWQAGERSVDNCIVDAVFNGNGAGSLMESFPENASLRECNQADLNCTE